MSRQLVVGGANTETANIGPLINDKQVEKVDCHNISSLSLPRTMFSLFALLHWYSKNQELLPNSEPAA